ncbi:MAG: hypothetical protein A2W93_07520 [Bacteroidetes bacterium GWF2_43_63]|nr:MAG: hypothetical protein A2W94_02630 [Bacteroidetes bacterium GWE2_42_42]OFY52767.1 MAG: hypothetical protein A2W93_07520 [Bacteroidetes bacterium GWF2_43_63]HBG70030.1 hypothetical protein [Bacteroidales bacterium]HCB62364.1 hypothetical protein [Bacteroidales bacterium]HCY22449.1 hypothetical protein [Bacteroidales bacterium]
MTTWKTAVFKRISTSFAADKEGGSVQGRRQRKPTKEKSVELNVIPAVSLKLNIINDRESILILLLIFKKTISQKFFCIDVHHSIILSIAVAHFHLCEA